MAREMTVQTHGVRKEYVMGNVVVEALKGVDLEIKRGEYISIMGPSGSGKSTLFNMIGGLDKPTEGNVFVDEVDIAQLDAYELAWLRCRKQTRRGLAHVVLVRRSDIDGVSYSA